jgi:type IV secretion system protein VirD4
MTPTKLLIGQILIVFVIIIAILWAATHWEAHALCYPPGTGMPLEFIRRLPLDRPCVHSQESCQYAVHVFRAS